MGRRSGEIPPCVKTYGLPLFCAAWAPLDKITRAPAADAAGEEEAEPPSGPQLVAVLGGGGGEGNSGVPNALILARFHLASNSLDDTPLFRLGTGSEVPYRIAVHPGGDGVVCSFPNACRWFEWNARNDREAKSLALRSSEKILVQLEDVGLQLALAFNGEGSTFATGGEDGHLRVFKWPSMEIILDQDEAHTSVKDLDFSLDSKFLVSMGQSGPCRIWDLTSSTCVANIPRENGEVFGFCKFSQSTDHNQILYITSMQGKHGTIVSYSPLSWKRISVKRIIRDAIPACSVSADGKFLAIGTVEGDVLIVNASNMRVHAMVKKAHMGSVTAVTFSQNTRALLSASFDSTARVTLIENKRTYGSSIIVLVIILLAILIYFVSFKGEF